MSGGSGEAVKQQEEQQAAIQQPVAQALQMAQYPAYMPGQQNMLADQMSQFYGGIPSEYIAMLGNNTQSVTRPTLRNATDIETYLNSLSIPVASSAASSSVAQPTSDIKDDPYEYMRRGR